MREVEPYSDEDQVLRTGVGVENLDIDARVALGGGEGDGWHIAAKSDLKNDNNKALWRSGCGVAAVSHSPSTGTEDVGKYSVWCWNAHGVSTRFVEIPCIRIIYKY